MSSEFFTLVVDGREIEARPVLTLVNSFFRILPVALIGKASINWMIRGYL